MISFHKKQNRFLFFLFLCFVFFMMSLSVHASQKPLTPLIQHRVCEGEECVLSFKLGRKLGQVFRPKKDFYVSVEIGQKPHVKIPQNAHVQFVDYYLVTHTLNPYLVTQNDLDRQFCGPDFIGMLGDAVYVVSYEGSSSYQVFFDDQFYSCHLETENIGKMITEQWYQIFYNQQIFWWSPQPECKGTHMLAEHCMVFDFLPIDSSSQLELKILPQRLSYQATRDKLNAITSPELFVTIQIKNNTNQSWQLQPKQMVLQKNDLVFETFHFEDSLDTNIPPRKIWQQKVQIGHLLTAIAPSVYEEKKYGEAQQYQDSFVIDFFLTFHQKSNTQKMIQIKSAPVKIAFELEKKKSDFMVARSFVSVWKIDASNEFMTLQNEASFFMICHNPDTTQYLFDNHFKAMSLNPARSLIHN